MTDEIECPTCDGHGPADCPRHYDRYWSIETYETEGPKCPYCGRQYTADDPVYFDEMLYTEETCDECGNTFDVEVYTSTSWTCSTRNLQSDDDTPPAPAMGGA